ncbi:MAG: quinone-dependent dihydroorotate dehydrogenase [Planctomycetota bacterium]
MGYLHRITRPLLFRLNPERAHALALRVARHGGGLAGRVLGGKRVDGLERTVAGIRFPNPLGVAAGMDKNGVGLRFWSAAGFGFAELGTVTPRAQTGNDKPRMWRLPPQRALVNHLGFPNAGAAAVAERVRRTRRPGDVVGLNLGKNRDTALEDAADDYVATLQATADVADYFAVNVSSPNTPELRRLQTRPYLQELLGKVREAAEGKPVFVKLSPDLDEAGLHEAAETVRDAGCAGLIATNTTLNKPEGCDLQGGLSGRPLAGRAAEVLGILRAVLGREFPIISVGGIDTPEEARARLEAGADLIQLYTGLVYEGPGLANRILRGLKSR